jgi:hypothetical protein
MQKAVTWLLLALAGCCLPVAALAGSVLELVEVLPMNIRGQGIAWDRTRPDVIYGIIRATARERAAGGSHKVTAFRLVNKP